MILRDDPQAAAVDLTAPIGTPHRLAKCCWCAAPLVVADVIKRRAWLCPTHWRRQVNQAVVVKANGAEHAKLLGVAQGTRVCLNVPLPSQVLFEECTAKNVLWGGQAGPGKSHGVRWWLYKRSLTIPGHESLLLRENWDQLEKTHIRKMALEVPLLGGRFADRTARFPDGSVIDCGHMADADAVSRYLSTEYGAIVPEEASLYPVDTEGTTPLGELSTRARKEYRDRSGALVKPRFMPVTNPGGPSAPWLTDMFVDHTPDFEKYPKLRPVYNAAGEQIKGYRPDQWAYIPAKLSDNAYMSDDYADESLSVLTSVRYQQLAEGDWHVFSGQFFQQWKESTHVQDLGLPEGVRWFRSLDWGYNAPGCVLWWAILPDHRQYIRAELKFQRMDEPELAAAVKAVEMTLGRPTIAYTAGDPSVFNKTGATHRHGGFVGQSIGETLGHYGLSITPADNERIIGWKRCHSILRPAPDGMPWLIVHPECSYLIRSIGSARSNKTNADDVDTASDDHAIDCWRYGAMSRPAPAMIHDTTQPSVGSIAYMRGRFKPKPGLLTRGRDAA